MSAQKAINISECIKTFLGDTLHSNKELAWVNKDQALERASQPPLHFEKSNIVLYYGATFNPPHEEYGKVLKIIYEEAAPLIAAHMGQTLAGALIGCSEWKDLMRKASEQSAKHVAAHVVALPTQDRFRLWHRGILSMKLDWANVTTFDGWNQFWDFFDFIRDFKDMKGGKFVIQFARVDKLDDTKRIPNSVFDESRLPEVFQPLHYRDQPGSGQSSRCRQTTDREGMEISIVTDVGGQGSCWMLDGQTRPKKLYKHTHWESVKSYSGATTVSNIWACKDESAGHKVYYVHTASKSGDGVQSMDAWKLIGDRAIQDHEKVQRLKGFFEPEMLLEKSQIFAPVVSD